jgi:hypothetical protein
MVLEVCVVEASALSDDALSGANMIKTFAQRAIAKCCLS